MNAPLLALPAPYEILDLPDQGTASFHIKSFAYGLIPITKKGQNTTTPVPGVRILVQPGDKKMGPSFWDITSQLLTAELKTYLDAGAFAGKLFTVKKFGVAPSARFSLEVKPG